jgi:hypothetical protein
MIIYYTVLSWFNAWITLYDDENVRVKARMKTDEVSVTLKKRVKVYKDIHPMVLNSILEFAETDSKTLGSFLDGYDEGVNTNG